MRAKEKATSTVATNQQRKYSDNKLNKQENSEVLTKNVPEITKVYNTIFLRPMTMREAEEISGIRRDKITRYVHMIGEKIQLVKTDKCPITKHMAGWYTTNEAYWELKEKQLSLDFWGGIEL